MEGLGDDDHVAGALALAVSLEGVTPGADGLGVGPAVRAVVAALAVRPRLRLGATPLEGDGVDVHSVRPLLVGELVVHGPVLGDLVEAVAQHGDREEDEAAPERDLRERD